MSVSEEKQKKVQLLEETRVRRGELQGKLEGLQQELAEQRAARLAGEGEVKKGIASLKKGITKLEKELADLQVDEVLERQIQELEREEHQEHVRAAEEGRNGAIESLEEAVGAYREARAGFLGAVAQLDQAREAARGAHFHWMGVTGTPWASATIELFVWDAQQAMAISILRGVMQAFKRADELEELRRRNPQLYGKGE